MPLGEISTILKDHQDELKRRGVLGIGVFGSFACNEANDVSDIDLLVEFDSQRGLFAFIDLKSYLENLLHRPIDLVTKNALHPALRERILNEVKSAF